MIDSSILTYVLIYLFFAIILIWKTYLLMLEARKISVLLPFFFISIATCFQAAFIFYDLFEWFIWGFIEFTFLTSLIWIFAILYWRNK